MARLRWYRTVKMASTRVEKWLNICWYWEVSYFLPNEPRRIRLVGMCYTEWGARRRALKALAGTLKRGYYTDEPKEAES